MSKIKLFCVPYAGGSAMIYKKWNRALNDSIELVPVELAGRGSRMNKNLYSNFNEAVEDVYSFIIENLDDNPYALFGHSMGSWIIFEVCNKIYKSFNIKPVHVFFSGNTAPHIKGDEKSIHNLPTSEFIKEIISMGDTPKELFEDEELSNIFLPILRSDYKLVETYECNHRDLKIDCDISVFNGEKDILTQKQLLGWSKYSDAGFNIFNFNGGHMFINENMNEVVDSINSILSKTHKEKNRQDIMEILYV